MSALDHLAGRAAARPAFLANQLLHYQIRHARSDADLAAELGCDVATLTPVRLCGAVRVGHFAEDCRVIAERFGLNVEVLERICWPW